MYLVSDSYQQQMKQPLRNVSHIKIQFGLVDPDATTNAYIASDSPKVPFATDPELVDLYSVPRWYNTLETNFWLLDGNLDLLPATNPDVYQGYISQQLSSEAGDYNSAVEFVIQFHQGVYAFRGLTFVFDTIQNNYPTEIEITGYLNKVQNFTTTVKINNSEYTLERDIPTIGSFVDKLVIKCSKNKLPNRRLRIQDIILGVIKKISSDTLTKSTWKRANDQMNTVLPSNEFSFTFYDINNEYNPDNPEGIWEYLDRGQSIDFSYGYELNNGTVEWIPGSTLYTDGTPSVSNSGALSEVTFNAVSRLQMLTDTYDESTFYEQGETLYNIAKMLLNWSGLEEPYFQLNNRLKNWYFYGYIPSMEVRQLLQLIANAGMCLLETDRNGYIIFSDRPTEPANFTYSLEDIYDSSPAISKYPYLKNLSVAVNSYIVESEVSEIATVEITGANNTSITVEYNAATGITINTSDGATLNSITKVCAQKALVNVSGTGKLVVQGKLINTNSSTITKNFNTVGEDCALTNEFICSNLHASTYLEWMGMILNKRNVYSFNDRGFPEIDTSDRVGVDTLFTEDKRVIVTQSEIQYTGALSGNTEVLG